MVENVRCIHPDLKCLRFRQLESLSETAVECPCTRHLDDVLTERSASARQGILQNDVTRCIRDCVERAHRSYTGSNGSALGIGNAAVSVAEVVAVVCAVAPLHLPAFGSKFPTMSGVPLAYSMFWAVMFAGAPVVA